MHAGKTAPLFAKHLFRVLRSGSDKSAGSKGGSVKLTKAICG